MRWRPSPPPAVSHALRSARSIAKFAIKIAGTSGFALAKKVIAPIILPPLKDAGFDLIWFGIETTIVMEIGPIHPPVPLNIFRAIMPFEA